MVLKFFYIGEINSKWGWKSIKTMKNNVNWGSVG